MCKQHFRFIAEVHFCGLCGGLHLCQDKSDLVLQKPHLSTVVGIQRISDVTSVICSTQPRFAKLILSSKKQKFDDFPRTTTITIKAAMPTLLPIDEPTTPTTDRAWWVMDDSNAKNHPSSPQGGGCFAYPHELWSFLAEEDHPTFDDEDDESGINATDSHSAGSSAVGDLEEDLYNDGNRAMNGCQTFLRCGGGLESIERGPEKHLDSEFNHSCFIRQRDSLDKGTLNAAVRTSSNDNSSSEELHGEKLWEESETVFDELQDEIAALRHRSDLINKSSKYKMMVNRRETAQIATIRAREEAKTFVEKKSFVARAKKGKTFGQKKVAFADNTSTESPKLLQNPQVDAKAHPSSAFRGLLGAEAPSRPEPNPGQTKPSDDPVATKISFFDDAERKHLQRALSPKSEAGSDPLIIDLEQINLGQHDLVRDVSSLTVDDNHASWQVMSGNEFGSNCVPPAILRKLQKLKGLKLSKTPSGNNSKVAPMTILPSSPSMASGVRTYAPSVASNETNSRFVYETNPNVNSYVAYFRRGGKASESIRLYEHITPDVFPTVEREVVVKIQASTVSATDIQVRKGLYWCDGSANSLNLPIVPGVAFCGIVHQMHRDNARAGINVGDRVISLMPAGANARHLCVSSDKLVKVPEGIKDPAVAACIPEIYLTAFQVLHLGQRNGSRYRKASLAGKCILVLGGATALGRALLEVAVAAGSNTVYATGKDKQFETICEAGGAPLGRDAFQWGSILSGRVDMMVAIDDSVGSSELRSEHMNLMKALDGRLIIVTSPEHDNRSIINLDERTEATGSTTGRKVIHYNVFESWNSDIKQAKRDLNHILKLVVSGSLQPKILERIPLSRVPKAHDLMEGKKLNGFIICEPWIKGRKKSAKKEPSLAAIDEVSPREEQQQQQQQQQHKPPVSPFTAAAQRFSPLAIFGDSAFWKTVTENSATTNTAPRPMDPNATPTADNLGRSNTFAEKSSSA
jgi:NADPH:quinone reductase-like Zn-dependent oxidoreductase